MNERPRAVPNWPTAKVFAGLHTCRMAVDENDVWTAVSAAGRALDAVPVVDGYEPDTADGRVLEATGQLHDAVLGLATALLYDAGNIVRSDNAGIRQRARGCVAQALMALQKVRDAQETAGLVAQRVAVPVATGRRFPHASRPDLPGRPGVARGAR